MWSQFIGNGRDRHSGRLVICDRQDVVVQRFSGKLRRIISQEWPLPRFLAWFSRRLARYAHSRSYRFTTLAAKRGDNMMQSRYTGARRFLLFLALVLVPGAVVQAGTTHWSVTIGSGYVPYGSSYGRGHRQQFGYQHGSIRKHHRFGRRARSQHRRPFRGYAMSQPGNYNCYRVETFKIGHTGIPVRIGRTICNSRHGIRLRVPGSSYIGNGY